MRMSVIAACGALSALAPALVAQQYVVSPAHFANANAPSANSFPFGNATAPYRYLQVHDDLSGTPRVFKGLAWRRSGTSITNVAAHSLTVDAFMSTAVTTGSTPSATFDNNHGTDRAQVITGKMFNWPATGATHVVAPFQFEMALDNAFAFLGTGSVAWELQISAKSGSGTSLNAYGSATGSTNPSAAVVRFGTGCTATGRTAAMTATASASMNWPTNSGTVTVTGANAPADASVLLTLGSNPTTWGSLPLPFLLPGTTSCYVYNDVLTTVAGTASTAGGVTFSFPIKPNAGWHGFILYSQIVAVDPPANALGLVISNTAEHNFIAPYGPSPGARVWLSGSVGPTGSIGANYLLVTRFEH